MEESKKQVRWLLMIPLFICQPIARSIQDLITAVDHCNSTTLIRFLLHLIKHVRVDVPSYHILLETRSSKTQRKIFIQAVGLDILRRDVRSLFHIFEIYYFNILLPHLLQAVPELLRLVFKNAGLILFKSEGK